jgi:antitoxin ParD1/3/4
MPKNTSVIIGDHFAEFIERQVSEGRYGSASDVVRAGLRLLEEREIKIEALRAAIVEGEESGPSTSFDFDEFLASRRRKAKRGEKAAS